MPNATTFSMPPIEAMIKRYKTLVSINHIKGISVDPFARGSKLCEITNDLDPSFGTTYNLDALEFLKSLATGSVNFLLFDPPYSPRQVSEVYKKLGMTVNMQTTQASFWGNLKKEISRVVCSDGIVISFGWNSGGIGKTNGFAQIEIMLVAHGGNHNDTICTVERKL